MKESDPPRSKLPRGVVALPRSRGGRGYRAAIRRGKGVEVHLGLYETPWLAAFAYSLAATALGREGGPPLDIPLREQPNAARVAAITAAVHRRLGLAPTPRRAEEVEPDAEELATLFEVAVVGFWRAQAADDAWEGTSAGLDAAAGRLVDAASLIFWRRTRGHTSPIAAMARLLSRRLDAAFRDAGLTREVLDDDGDEPWRVARWLVHPDAFRGGRGRGFRDEVRFLYPEHFDDDERPDALPPWATVLGVTPPLTLERIQAAYRRQSRVTHPDVGGTHAEFIRLNDAYEEAKAYCSARMA